MRCKDIIRYYTREAVSRTLIARSRRLRVGPARILEAKTNIASTPDNLAIFRRAQFAMTGARKRNDRRGNWLAD